MSGDYSRHRFDPRLNFAEVLMQQGRVQLDADWNELVEVIARRLQAGSLDTFGQAVVPRETPTGFEIIPSAGALTIGRGRIYVDGVLAENHGTGVTGWDRRLAETLGSATVTYAQQPYLPGAPALPNTGQHLAYLDVFQREITSVERPTLIDQAVNLDTTTRMQTVWQVKLLKNTGAVTKQTRDEDIPGWLDVIRPSDGRLTTSYTPVAVDPNPCSPSVEGGYRGLENQLYRVEIHEGGALGAATFKWSRDNATVASRVTKISAANRITVDSLGKDDVLGFRDGDWVEVIDDGIELRGELGQIRRIKPIDGVDKVARTLTLEANLTLFPVDADNPVNPAQNIRVRRWDSAGALAIPAGGGPVALENGIAVKFSLAANNGKFKRGDYWTFAARTADASIEILDAVPPRGVHHHYCRLAAINFPTGKTDLRNFWPPEAAPATTVEHDGCGCTICVTPAGHADGSHTIQAAIDTVAKTGGTVCLGPGRYPLKEPLKISGAMSLRLTGQGWQTMIAAPAGHPAVIVDESFNVAIERVMIAAEPGSGTPALIVLRNGTGLAVTDCSLAAIGNKRAPAAAAIGMSGYQMGVQVARNVIVAARGITRLHDRKDSYLVTRGIEIDDNSMMCLEAGIVFDPPAMHYHDTRISRNLIKGCSDAAIVMTGATLKGSSIDIAGNHISVPGTGMTVATSGTRIKDNDIIGTRGTSGDDGIAIVAGASKWVDGLQIVGNRIQFLSGIAIALRAPINWAAIKRNDLLSTGGGIVMEEGAYANHVAIDNNRLDAIGTMVNGKDVAAIGVRLQKVRRGDVVGNSINGVGRAAVQGAQRAGVQTIGCETVRISGNRIAGIGPAGEFVGEGAGIEVVSPFSRVDVTENVVQRSASERDKLAPGEWRTLEIGSEPTGAKIMGTHTTMMRSKGALVVVSKDKAVVVEDRGPGQVIVRGNQLRAEMTRTSAVRISRGSICTFSENQCDAPDGTSRDAVVSINQGSVVANGNHVNGGRRAIAINISGPKATVVGNFVSAEIMVNGAPLHDPFRKLNVFP